MNFGVYVLRRILAIVPTLFGISLVAFLLINMAPGGPVEQALQKIKYAGAMGQGGGGGGAASGSSGRSGLDAAVTEEVLESLKRQYGFDKPIHIRYFIWLGNLSRLDFGESFIHHRKVVDLIIAKFPVSIMFGLVSFFLMYLVCIPLGIAKAVWNNTRFDVGSSVLIFSTYSMPAFMLAILLVVTMGPGGLDWFPIQGIKSEWYSDLSFWDQITDRIHHAFLPLLCYCIGSFATLTMLMKNSILDEIQRDYARTARAKGLDEKTVVVRHVLRNALLPIATGLGSFLGIFFAGSLLIEQIFNLDGIGLLSYTSVLQRDYNVIMGLLMIQSFTSLAGNLISDILYVLLDPRIDFSAQG